MKKAAFFFIVLIIFMALAGCGENEYPPLTQTEDKTSPLHTTQVNKYKDLEFTVISNEIVIDGVLVDTRTIHIPETINGYTVAEIGESAFYQKKCEAIHLPSTIKAIRSEAFYRCSALTEITIPSATETIVGNPFFRCSSLVNIYVEKENKYYCDIDGVLYDVSQTMLIAYPEGRNETAYYIPEGITTINDMAFGYAPTLERVVIPESVTIFPEYNLFELCEGICIVVVPGSSAERYASTYGLRTEILLS